MRDTCLGFEDGLLFLGAGSEEGFSTTLASPVVDKQISIDIQLEAISMRFLFHRSSDLWEPHLSTTCNGQAELELHILRPRLKHPPQVKSVVRSKTLRLVNGDERIRFVDDVRDDRIPLRNELVLAVVVPRSHETWLPVLSDDIIIECRKRLNSWYYVSAYAGLP